jgi:hypothetical protein
MPIPPFWAAAFYVHVLKDEVTTHCLNLAVAHSTGTPQDNLVAKLFNQPNPIICPSRWKCAPG